MWNNVLRYFHTIRYLLPVQWYYQFLKAIRIGKKQYRINSKAKVNSAPFTLQHSILAIGLWRKNNTFCFLNIEHRFDNHIRWDEMVHGKLWGYHLNYFDFLMDPSMTKTEARSIIYNYIHQLPVLKNGIEPYPVSVRIMNWIKAVVLFDLRDREIQESIFHQTQWLKKNLEYHLLGNHLFENGFALLFAGYFLDHAPFSDAGRRIILKEIDRQILSDGGHAERSTMYHSLILYRMLDTINLLQSNSINDTRFLSVVRKAAGQMLGWLEAVSFSDATLLWVNDGFRNQAPTLPQLLMYAERLGITIEKITLGASGYRKIQSPVFEMLIDVGPVGLDHQPGHAHADTFSFGLFHKGESIVTDTGTSTYETGAIRDYERSTAAHNTVEVSNLNSSDVWKSFRVGRRAEITYLLEEPRKIVARHDGYKQIGITHTRTWEWSDSSITITDELRGDQTKPAKAYFHFSPNIQSKRQTDSAIEINDHVKFTFSGQEVIHEKKYLYSDGFNRRVEAQCIEASFAKKLVTQIVFSPE
jgi:uncharacterized heparinase superfamily protein